MVKVGVVFDAFFADPGEYLADARALEAADIDSVWISAEASGEILLAAIAAVTTRIRLGLLASRTDVAAALARSVDTLQRLSRSRALVGVPRDGVVEVVAPVAERWLYVPMPKDRAAWQETLARGEADGVAGVLVPQDDRLLDILRTPLEEDDRRDLVLAQG